MKNTLIIIAFLIGTVTGGMLDNYHNKKEVKPVKPIKKADIKCQITDHSMNKHIMPCRIVNEYLNKVEL
ncbi:MAG: hypothetical protein PHT07_20835 [Paludibacter sp.]|nr:hypothetical protein [Paludibacter sp.]